MIDEYLERIELEAAKDKIDLDYLTRIHVAHLTHIPFETFDMTDLKQLNIDEDNIFQELVRNRRGGVCFQMNGLLMSVLKGLGCDVKLISCRVFKPDLDAYRDRDSHVALLVTLEDKTEYLCDVGFTREFLTPIRFQLDSIQFSNNAIFRLVRTEDQRFYQLERGSFKEYLPNVLTSSNPLRTETIDIDPNFIDWNRCYRFSVDFRDENLILNDFQDAAQFALYSPMISLNYTTVCHIYKIGPRVEEFGIVGRKYYRSYLENGKEIRHESMLDNLDDEQLKRLLVDTFSLAMDRKIQLRP